MVTYEVYFAITDLFARCANALDDERLDDWLDCFGEDGSYYIRSRENWLRNLPLTLLQLDNKDMMHDRVVSLREANVTNIHRDQRVNSLPQITAGEAGTWNVVSGYAMYTTNAEGRSTLFSVGSYVDRVRVADGKARFIERTVIVDTFAISNMLSTPI
ncbi:MAG TPA: aromatic-ring-hydroxylating dioxygenase subunit beta [Bordetella sp.]